jgi:hypothetical protein
MGNLPVAGGLLSYGPNYVDQHRLLYEEVLRLKKFPNFKSAPMLGYLLNVMGVKVGERKEGHRFQEYQLRKAVIEFSRKNYLWLVKRQHKVAASVLFGTIDTSCFLGRDSQRAAPRLIFAQAPPYAAACRRHLSDLEEPACPPWASAPRVKRDVHSDRTAISGEEIPRGGAAS